MEVESTEVGICDVKMKIKQTELLCQYMSVGSIDTDSYIIMMNYSQSIEVTNQLILKRFAKHGPT